MFLTRAFNHHVSVIEKLFSNLEKINETSDEERKKLGLISKEGEYETICHDLDYHSKKLKEEFSDLMEDLEFDISEIDYQS